MRSVVRIYTRKGDDGTTGLLYGGRVRKDSPIIEANGAVDEAQAILGLARAETEPGSELADLLVALERDLWVLMAEVATAPDRRDRLTAGTSLVTKDMVDALESRIDQLSDRFDMPSEFVVPGQNRVSAALDVARTVVRRAERLVAASPPADGSLVGPYLNRLSDLLWTMARWQEGEHLVTRTKPRRIDARKAPEAKRGG
jgi:cob(I)alamin adenosyltransferase